MTATQKISLDELAALNDELVALSRAGVPLDHGLKLLAKELSGKKQNLIEEISTELSAGKSLDEIFAQRGDTFPAFYPAVIQAGLKSGRLTQVLEGVSLVAKRIKELRTAYYLSLPYPLMVLCLTGCFMTFMGLKITPTLQEVIEFFVSDKTHWIYSVQSIYSTILPWGICLIPFVILLFLTWMWFGRPAHRLLQSDTVLGNLFWGSRKIATLSRHAIFLDCLGLMLRNEVPLPESVKYAAAATGSNQMKLAGESWSKALTRGETRQVPLELSPLGSWLFQGQATQQQLGNWLELAAKRAHDRATRLSQWLSQLIPFVLTFFVSGSLVFFYALSLFLPWTALMTQMSLPN